MPVCSKCGATLACPGHGDHAIGSSGTECTTKKGEIWVNVVDHESKPVEGVEVESQGVRKKTDKGGFVAFDKLEDGDYTVEALDTYLEGEPARKSAAVKHGDVKLAKFKLEQPNEVTPKIECEYKAVLLDRKLSDHQSGGEKIVADPTYIEVAAEQTAGDKHPFQGTGKLEFAPANVEAFLDEKCTEKLEKDLTAEQLTGTDKLKIWLRGKTAGKFDAKLTLSDSGNDKFVKLADEPAEAKMGVVEIKMGVHGQDLEEIKKKEIDPDAGTIDEYHDKLEDLKDDKWPKQKALGDEDKVKKGPILHKQKDGAHGRSLLRLEKLDAGQWPDETDDYEIYVNRTNTSGAVEIWDKEVEGTAMKLPAGPFKVKDLKAKEKDLWVEGKTETEKLRDVRLDVTLDRPDGGLAKESKRNADWGLFSVVAIKEVKLAYEAEAGKPNAWDDKKKRFFINFKTGDDGRKIELQAELTKKIEGIVVHFMLAEHEKNRKEPNWGEDLPDGSGDGDEWAWKDIDEAVKHEDKDDRKKLLHLSEKTDAEGKAKKEVMLSRFGGDKFHLCAYVEEDAHLCKFVDGHAELGKRKPVMAKDPIQVWRKFWYEEIRVEGIDVAGFGDAADTYEDVRALMTPTDVRTMSRADADALNPKMIYPRFQLSYYLSPDGSRYLNNFAGDESDGLMVGDDNEGEVWKKSQPSDETPVMIPMINVHGLWIGDGQTGTNSTPIVEIATLPAEGIDLEMDKKLLDPPIQGGDLFVSGTFTTAHQDGTGAWVVDQNGVSLQAGDVYLHKDRSDPFVVKIKLPAAYTAGAATHIQFSDLVLEGATNFLGTSYDDGIVNAYTPNDEQDFINTINHEIGHSFKQVSKTQPTGIPAHTLQYDKDGSHCDYKNKSCLMYESGPQPGSLNRYCPVCHPYVLVQDMSEV
jgi:hypothetical protein